MKLNPVFLLLAACLLGGCNWIQFAVFRGQMHAIDQYTAWEEKSGVSVFVFKAPLLSIGDLNEFGIFPETIDGHHAVLRYRRVDGSPFRPGDYDIHLELTQGRLSGLVLPRAIIDGLGQDNIRQLFAMMGGRSGRPLGLESVSKTQLRSAGLFPGNDDTLGREVVIDLEPRDQRNRPILITMLETAEPGYYSSFHFNLKRRDRR